MHSAVQTAAVTIIGYKPLADLNFARYTQHYGSYMPSRPLGSISHWFNPIMPALCWHNKTTYYAQSNASTLCLSLGMEDVEGRGGGMLGIFKVSIDTWLNSQL